MGMAKPALDQIVERRALLPTSQQCWGKRRASWRIQMA
jgi:hypothetical protein